MQRLSQEIVEQVIDQSDTAQFYEENWAFQTGVPLHLVRKTRVEGPTKGPVVLVHGFAQNRYSWHTSKRSMQNGLAALGWDVYNLELRGHGLSRDRRGTVPNSFADYAEDVARVAEHFKGRAFFVGHSLGGAACYAGATLAPMAGVVGIGALFTFGQGNASLKRVARLTQVVRPFLLERSRINTSWAGRQIGRLYGLADVLGYGFPLAGWTPGSVEREIIEERLELGFDWTSLHIWTEMSRWARLGSPSFVHDWQNTEVPVYVMVGDWDRLMPMRDARGAYDLAGSKDRTLHLFDHWDHQVHWGHLDLILGKHASQHTWPALDAWMSRRQA